MGVLGSGGSVIWGLWDLEDLEFGCSGIWSLWALGALGPGLGKIVIPWCEYQWSAPEAEAPFFAIERVDFRVFGRVAQPSGVWSHRKGFATENALVHRSHE